MSSFLENWKDAYRSALHFMFHPDKATKENFDTHDLINYVAYLMLLPAVIATIATGFVVLGISLVPGVPIGGALFLPLLVFAVSIGYVMLVVLGDAAGIHFFLWLTRADKRGLDKTFAAAAAAAAPFLVALPVLMLLGWWIVSSGVSILTGSLGISPAGGAAFAALGLIAGMFLVGLVFAVTFIWGFVIQVIALANQHGISRARAFLASIIPIILVGAYYGFVVYTAFLSYSHGLTALSQYQTPPGLLMTTLGT